MKHANRLAGTYGRAVAAAAALSVAPHGGEVTVLLGCVLAVVHVSVVLPAVWSRKPARRRDARNLIALLKHSNSDK